MADQLKRTPLYDRHVALGARMVPFGGWEMPVQYSGIKEEHNAVRTGVGVFDVSHMGEFEVRGPQTLAFLNYLCANDATKLDVGDAQYSMLLNEAGGTIDDVIVYRLGDEHAMLVVNAGNIEKDWAHVARVAEGFDGVTVANHSDDWALLAVQGPRAVDVVDALVDVDARGMDYYGVQAGHAGDLDVIVARTGYTGEDGFELFVRSEDAPELWDRVLEAGEPYAIQPAGLGARDTLRLEASMPLYGHELSDDISPLEAGLGYFVAKEGDYIGAARQRELREQGLSRKLVMLEMQERGIPREGYNVYAGTDEPVGVITSGTFAPHLNKPIAQALVDAEHAKVGTTLNVDIRGRHAVAEVVKRPFYKRQKS